MPVRSRAKPWVIGLFVACTLPNSTWAASSIQLIVPFGRGGATDIIFREMAPSVERFVAEPVIVTNLPGVSATRGAIQVKSAKPDGSMLLVTHQALLHSHLEGAVRYSHHDFAPVALLTRTVNIPTTYFGHPVARMDEMAAYIQAHPHEVRVGTITYSTAQAFWQELLSIIGIELNRVKLVRFPDSASQITALLGREIDFAMLDLPSSGYLYRAGNLRPLGVAYSERLPTLPDVPTLGEQGIPMIHTSDRGVFAPHGTPSSRLAFLANAFGHALKDEEFVRYLEFELGSFVDYRPLEQFQVYLDQQVRELRR